MKWLSIPLALLLAWPSGAELIPADRLYTTGWSTSGVTGGIPDSSTMTVSTTITSTGDLTDRTAAINNAIAACPSNQVVELGAGTFRVTGRLVMTIEKGVVLRGAGRTATTIDSTSTANEAFRIGDDNYDWPGFGTTGVNLGADEAQGQTVITMSDTSTFSVGQFVMFRQGNNTNASLPVIGDNSHNQDRDMSHMTKITAKDASTITIADPLPYAFELQWDAEVRGFTDGFAVRCGVEDLTFSQANGAGSNNGISFQNASECWIKNVIVRDVGNYAITFLHANHCTVEESFVDGVKNYGSSNCAGVLWQYSSMNLFQNNIVRRSFPNVEINFGSTGNVIAYNAMKESNTASLDSHGAHNAYNLFEGNVSPNLKPDGYFGSDSHATALRNRLTGSDDTNIAHHIPPVDLKRFTRYYNLVGNVFGLSTSASYEQTASGPSGETIYQLGYPNIGNDTYTGTASPLANDWWADWPGGSELPGGFQERDLDVSGTLIRKGNWNTSDQAVPASETTSGDTIPDSYYLSGKPSWFGNLDWPPFDPTGASTATYRTNYMLSLVRIPAGYLYLYGTNPPAVPTDLGGIRGARLRNFMRPR